MGFAVDIVARTVLLPILIVQALMCRRTARCLPAPAGPRSGRAGEGPPLRLLILGDSSALGVGVGHQDQALSGQLAQKLGRQFAVEWDLVATIGADTGSTLERLRQIEDRDYDVVLTCLGVNDVTHRVSRRRFTAQTRELMDRIAAKFGDPVVVVSLLPPVHHFPLLPNPLRWLLGRQAIRFNGVLRRLARGWPKAHLIGKGIALVPEVMSPDGFHPGAPVYAEWANQVVEAISRAGLAPEAVSIDLSRASA